MILEIDAGNSRIKWRLHDPQAHGASGSGIAASISAGVDLDADLAALARQVEAGSGAAIGRIRVSNVRGDAFRAGLDTLAAEKWRLVPGYARVAAQAAGVTNAYREPASMGVDRWLAMLAAWRLAGGACCILDCGSATTFDWIDAGGRHKGGYIVPGLRLMQESLARKTRALDIPVPGWKRIEPGVNTATAISHGILAMACGFASHCHTLAEGSGQAMKWYLTGGDAALVSPHLAWPHTLVPDLVLDGLAIALP